MKKRITSLIYASSLGKYQTTLYNKEGKPYQSSVRGGCLTIILILILGTIMVYFLVDCLDGSHQNLDLSGVPMRGYNQTDTKEIFANMTMCEGRDCEEIKIRDYRDMYGDYFQFLTYNTSNCS